MVSSSIKLGPYTVPKISYGDVKPGDFLCTYEALTTRADLLFIESAQKYASWKKRPELNKMFHAEIILEKYPRIGVYKIAHADGMCKKMVIQDDNFKEHHPGQAFIIFRAKDRAIQKEIVAVANKTAEPNNGHVCRTILFESLKDRMRYIFEYFLFENLWKNASAKTMRNLATMMWNYAKTGKFYGKNGVGRKEMSCIEYVANIVNVATSRVLCRKLQDNQQATDENAIYHQIKELTKQEGLPLQYSHPDVTPASYVDFFLKNSKVFQTVGYLGTIREPLEGPHLDLKGRAIQISPSILSDTFPLDYVKTRSNIAFVANIMKTLGMITDSWQIYSKAVKDPVKVKTLCCFLHAKLHSLLPSTKNLPDLNNVCDPFLQKIEDFINTREKHGQDSSTEDFPNIDSLTQEEKIQILNLEKDFIKSAAIDRSDKTLKLSINIFDIEMVEINRIKAIAHRIFNIGRTLLKTVIFSLFYFGFFIAGRILEKIANSREIICKKKIEELLIVHEEVRKNGRITLSTNSIVNGHRPWMHYSIDDGKSWQLEPFKIQGTVWNAAFHVPESINVSYRIFIGPNDINDTDPIGKALAQQKEITFVSSDVIQKTKEQDSEYLILPTCIDPVWNDKISNQSKNETIISFQKKCNDAGPTDNWPFSIQDYEKNYTFLDESLELLTVEKSLEEQEIIGHIMTFIESEMGIKVSPEQIQFLKGGLGKGLSGDQLYKVVDKHNHPLFVIKVYMKSRGKFSREFFSLLNHETLNLKSLNIPTIVGMAASKIEDKRIYFLATNFIAGTSVYDMFMDLSKHKVGSAERGESFKKLIHIYSKLGNGIAELHQASKGDSGPLHPAFADLLKCFSKNAFLKFKDKLNPSFLKKLEDYFETNFSTESKKHFIRGYHHGDINTGNIIFNPVTDKLSIIDWPDGSFAVGKNGKPLGIPFYDIIQIKNELLNMKSLGVTEDETSQLYKVFESQYISSGLPLPSTETMNFFSSIDLMGSLKWFIDKKDIFEVNHLKMAEEIYRTKLEKLETLIA